jgi:uncharacterized protein (DUF4415 family)
MKNTSRPKTKAKPTEDLQPEYKLNYAAAKPNRFAGATQPGAVAILLDPDVAEVFKNGNSVNEVLRALLTTMPSRRKSG